MPSQVGLGVWPGDRGSTRRLGISWGRQDGFESQGDADDLGVGVMWVMVAGLRDTLEKLE